MPPAVPFSHRVIQGRFARSLLLTLLALASIPFFLMGGGAYLHARNLLRAQASDLLASVVETQGQRLVDTLASGQVMLARQMNQPRLARAISSVLAARPETQTFTDLRGEILGVLRAANDPRIYYTQFLVIDPSGQTVVSTRAAWQGLSLKLPTATLGQAQPFSLAGFGADFGLPPTNDRSMPAYLWLTAIPVQDEQGALISYVVGVSESQLLKAWIQSAAFYASSEYFFDRSGNLVGANPYPNHIEKLVAMEPSAEQRSLLEDFARSDSASTPVVAGTGEVNTSQGEPILTAYTWLPELATGWAVEIPQAQVYSQVNALLTFAAGIFIAAFLLLGMIFWQAIQGLSRPLSGLTAAVQNFAGGDWSQRAPVIREDEFGELAQAFNQMADELTQLYYSLRERVAEATADMRLNAELSQMAIANPQLESFIPQALHLLGKRFDGSRAEVSLEAPPGGLNTPGQPQRFAVELNGRSTASQIQVPLQVNRQSLGYLQLESSQSERFHPEDQRFLTDYANQFALVIQNAQLRSQVETDLQSTADRFQDQARSLQARLNELETLTAVSQALATSAGSADLFALIHQQVEHSLGQLDFLVALCNAADRTVEIPYLCENGQIGSIPAYPLGEGLTSIVIQTGRPLRLVEDTEQRASQLGAKTLGRRARSWLGVPIRFGGESLGAIVVQDSERYRRFGPEEEALLVTLASQVSVFIRYLTLLENARRQAEHDRLLFEITNKIHRSINLETILQTTARELGAALGAPRASIEILPGPAGD